jgi:CheY-like chemotaxis protein
LLLSARRSGDRLRINVLDTGIGIPQDKLPHIFEEFYQVGNPGRDHTKGLGLGLAIVKRLARLIGAELQVRSREGRGSFFTVWLPASPPPRSTLSIRSAGDSPIDGRHIMLIEDNPRVRIGFQMLLESWNCTISCAESGEQALEIGEQEGWRFDMIIADHRLGAGMSGTQTALQIAVRAGRSIPTLIVTGDTAPERIAEIHASGFEIMHKPVMPEELSRRMACLLR